MDKKLKQRGVLRSSFTKTVKKVKAALSSKEADSCHISGLMEMLEEKHQEMTTMDRYIYEEMLKQDESNENDLEKELDTTDEYNVQWKTLKAEVATANQAPLKAVSMYGSQPSIHNSVIAENKRTFKLPKLELVKFSGDLREWLQFWAQFKRIDEDLSIEESDKFQYLIQATTQGSRARELVESFPATGENYAKAVECLKTRFGREDLLVEVYVRELLGLVLQNTLAVEKIPLTSLYDKLECHLRALETLEVSTEKCASMLLPLVESCLPEDILRVWQRNYIPVSRSPSQNSLEATTNTSKERLDRLMLFLRNELENEEKVKLALSGFGFKNNSSTIVGRRRNNKEAVKHNYKSPPTATGLLNASKVRATNNCTFCQGKHNSVDCSSFRDMPAEEKINVLDKKRCCFNCLKTGHKSSDCWNKNRCKFCNKKHHSLICSDSDHKIDGKGNDSAQMNEKSDKALACLESSPNVALQTLLVKLRGNGKDRIVRAIIDTASQRSYILKDTAIEVKYIPKRQERVQHNLFGGVKSEVMQHQVYMIYLSSLDEKYQCHFEARDQTLICERIPPMKQGPWLQELKMYNIRLNDFEDKPIEVLIGADVAGKLFTGNVQVLSSGLAAIETDLGWTIMGCLPIETKTDDTTMLVTTMMTNGSDIGNLWSLDVLGISDPAEKKKRMELQEAAVEHFKNTVSVDEEGRFQIHLPWLENHPALPSNFNIATKRLITTSKRLKSDGLFDDYGRIFDVWLKEEVIERVPDDQLELHGHYLPHRHVVKENSTTRIRPVFDASCKEKGKASLNDCVEKGVNLIELIPSILTKFRLRKIGVISDIQKAFLQIGIYERDRDYLRFLWYDEKGKLIVFRHRRVVFGVSCSPFLLGAVINHHLRDALRRCLQEKDTLKANIIEKLITSFYVDNCVTSVENETELQEFIREATAILKERKLELRGWEYSYQNTVTNEESLCNVLGIKWSKTRDILKINVDICNSIEEPITKRLILSFTHRLFDPIGVTCAITLLPKLLLQQLWFEKIGWDQEVKEDIQKKFLKWKYDLKYLNEVEIPRRLTITDEVLANCSLHVFCDASQDAYATAIYLRTIADGDKNRTVRVQLVQAKSRITPSGKSGRRITIPRLELLAALIGARLYDSVIKDLASVIRETTFWSDSTTILAWINRNESWDIFVKNRVEEIRTLTNNGLWRYVPGIHNPADLPSRGCSAKKLLEIRWWEGPDWLKEPEELWPMSEGIYDETEINQEKKPKVISSADLLTLSNGPDWYYRRFSTFEKIVRVMAWTLRFVKNTKDNKNSLVKGDLNTDEICRAERKIFLLIQRESFGDVTDQRLAGMFPYIDEDGLIRIKTKIANSDEIKDFCHPIVLPKHSHPVVFSLIMKIHRESTHAGIQTMVVILRKRFWILGGRQSIRTVLGKCKICQRQRAKHADADTTPLPKDRVRDAKVFEIVGVDLAGPVFLRGVDKTSTQKAWICLFTCAVYRCVHLELLTSLSTDRFLQGLRRFISRRGRPLIIYSDNGTNFVGSANALEKVNWDEICKYSTIHRFQWKFIPPTAAWWGGWWERLVGLTKQLLRRVLGRASLDYEEMVTALCDCEAVINSRPLTYVSNDGADLTPITPDHFLKEIEEVGVPDLDLLDKTNLNKRLRYRQQIKETLRRRFREEYLGQLRMFSKKHHQRPIKEDEIVLIGSDNSKRLEWPMARVTHLIPGKDGVVRLVRLKTMNGEVLRPIQRVFLLEMEPLIEGETHRFEASLDEGSNIAERTPSQESTKDKSITNRPEVVKEDQDLVRRTMRGRLLKQPKKLNL